MNNEYEWAKKIVRGTYTPLWNNVSKPTVTVARTCLVSSLKKGTIINLNYCCNQVEKILEELGVKESSENISKRMRARVAAEMDSLATEGVVEIVKKGRIWKKL